MSLISDIAVLDPDIKSLSWSRGAQAEQVTAAMLRDRLADVCLHVILLHCGTAVGAHDLPDGGKVDDFTRKGERLVRGKETLDLMPAAGFEQRWSITGTGGLAVETAESTAGPMGHKLAAAMGYGAATENGARYTAFSLYAVRTALRVLDELLRVQPAGAAAQPLGMWYRLSPPSADDPSWHIPGKLRVTLEPDVLAPITIRGAALQVTPGDLIDRWRTTLHTLMHSSEPGHLLGTEYPAYSLFGLAKACAMDGSLLGTVNWKDVLAKCDESVKCTNDDTMQITLGLLVAADAFGPRRIVDVPSAPGAK